MVPQCTPNVVSNRFLPFFVLPHLLSIVMLMTLGRHGQAELPPLIPREILFGNPDKVAPFISPDGKMMAYRKEDERGVMQVWLKTIGQEDDRPITSEQTRGVRRFHWAPNSKQIFYFQDTDGNEDYHLYAVDLASADVRDLTPLEGVRVQNLFIRLELPDEILLTHNGRNKEVFDVYRLNLNTGGLELDTENPGDVSSWIADSQLRIRGAHVLTPEGVTELRVRSDVDSPWRTWLTADPEESLTFSFVAFTDDDRSALLRSAIGRDTVALIKKEIETGDEHVVAASDESDVTSTRIHPTTGNVEAVGFTTARITWKVIDPSVQADFDALARLGDGDIAFGNRDRADKTWLVALYSDQHTTRYYAWDREAQQATLLFAAQPELDKYELAEMKPISFTARDGLTIHGYLTLPVGVEPANLPMVLNVHGGPWARDYWGLDRSAQWFANRGYACLQINFRGSTGYGKKFLNAGNREWGKAMHDDLIDACDWAVEQGYADPQKIGIFGGSYGGYAVLVGLTSTPEYFACGVDFVGPSNLFTLLRTVPPYWKPRRADFNQRIGNVDDPADEPLLREASPLFKADRIVRPLLIGQGANDPRVKQAESEQIVDAIAQNQGSVTYVLYPDEGHGFGRPENDIDFRARSERFLAEHLGGRYEPLEGDCFPGSTAVVRAVGQ